MTDEVEGRPPLTREAIIEAARARVVSDGPDGVSLRPLAASLGVTAPALYAHFDSKRHLLAAVAADELEALGRRMAEAAVGVDDPIERIKAQSRAYVDHARAHPALFEVLFLHQPVWSADPSTVPAADHSGEAEASRVFAEGAAGIADAVAAGLLRGPDPVLASLTIWSAVHGVATIVARGPGLDAAYESALVDSVIDAIVDGLRP